ncbi:homoserine kinase [Thalassobacillus devorans]|uniref:Homoserine kinase n=1 Tax=Thalassobacillus devorans TaxID=279813 RepID=A0ABQ1PNM9_9BACI|nr:homoserine kinase [Thalassobacillus devorans]NIK30441.1 homoserine kinase [Thalassobacillus devorans]GGD00248.1 homoserine kinase [Thalassobacillus devorans]
MSASGMFTIKVPASTANLGPGFDSVGLAVNRYLTLDVSPDSQWSFEAETENLRGLPAGKDNLIYQVAAFVAENHKKSSLPPVNVKLSSDFPMSKGFGSSAAAIVAGIELADYLLDLHLSLKEKARYASLYEGHPDNVAASLYGGLVIGCHQEKETHIVLGGRPEVDIVAVIPSYEMKTDASRGLLPESFPYAKAVEASSISNVLVASLLQHDWDLAGKMMTEDLFHQPYRTQSIPEWETVMTLKESLPIYGVAISGAGPILLCFTPPGKGETVKRKLASSFPGEAVVELLLPAETGVSVDSYKCSAAK